MKRMNGFFLSTVLLGIAMSLFVPTAVMADPSIVSFSASSYQVNENGVSTVIDIALQLPPDTYIIDDFQSYADTSGLQAVWAPDQYDHTGLISSYTLNTDHTKYMEINANLEPIPYYDIMTRNLNGANWSGKTVLTIDYKGALAKSSESLEVEILDAANWANKWRSGTWDYPNDGIWHTKDIDISSCPWLNNVGPVRVVVKGKDCGTTRVGIDNIRVGNISPVTVSYTTGDGTATNGTGNDYYTASGALQFDPGVTSQSFEIPIINDPFVESPETVIITLSEPVNATISGTNPVVLTINDNDPVPATARLEPAIGSYVSIVPDNQDTIEAFCSRTGYSPAAFTKYFGFPAVADDFESYASTTALKAVWAPDQYAKTGLISSWGLNGSHTKYMDISANMGRSPYYDVMTMNLNGADWSGKATLTIDYKASSSRSAERLEVEILDAANWANKWRSGTWDYPNDGIWRTKTIDISSCPWLNNVGPVRIVIKAKNYKWTYVSIDNLKVGDWTSMTTFLNEISAYSGMALMVVDPRSGLDQISQTDINTFANMCSTYNNLGVPIIVRFGHEMNGDWYPRWSMKPDQYRAKFRALADAIHSRAPSTAIAWTPNVAGGYPNGIYKNMTQAEYITGGYGTAADWALLDTNADGILSDTLGEKDDPYSPFYPGDQYVDWVGLSCYHAWPWNNDIPEPRKLTDQFTGNYNGVNGDDRWNPDFYAEYAEAKGKPMMIAETGAWYDPTNPLGSSEEDIKLAWVEQVYNLSGPTANALDIAELFPRIKLITWFNQLKAEEGAYCDWRISENSIVRTNWVDRLNTPKWGSGYFLDVNDAP